MDDDNDAALGYPNTYVPVKDASPVFDPALQHFGYGLRAGEPRFQSEEDRTRWVLARRSVIDRVLTVIHASPWRDRLVMRGSYLLKAWLGDAAREPGDVDFVVRPSSVAWNSDEVDQLFLSLRQGIAQHADGPGATIDIAAIATDNIWMYSRAAGRRIVFPWHQKEDTPARLPSYAERPPDGYVQVDFVFGEELLDEPVLTDIPLLISGRSLSFLTASKRLSLAWKLLWLQSDSYPQGKDLYDAALLAELTELPQELLNGVLATADEPLWIDSSIADWFVDWDNFLLEYPSIGGSEADWKQRLKNSLRITGCKEFVGDFETHLTVALMFWDKGKVAPLRDWADSHSMKFTHIILDRGVCASQPMITFYGNGTLSDQLNKAAEIVQQMKASGFHVCRTKIEAGIHNADVPLTKSQAQPRMYFEHHIKLLLPEQFELSELTTIAEPLGGHLSRNARRTRDDGRDERFLTQRCYNCGHDEAHQQLESLQQAIPVACEILEVEEEFVVYDSNDRIDSDWIIRQPAE